MSLAEVDDVKQQAIDRVDSYLNSLQLAKTPDRIWAVRGVLHRHTVRFYDRTVHVRNKQQAKELKSELRVLYAQYSTTLSHAVSVWYGPDHRFYIPGNAMSEKTISCRSAKLEDVIDELFHLT